MHISHWREFLKLTFQALALCQSKLRQCRKYRKLKPWNRWEGKGRKGREGKGREGKEGKGREGREGKGREGKEGKGGKGREGKEGKGRKGREGKGRKGREGKGRKGRERREGKWEHGEVKNTTRNWFNEKCSLVL